MGPIAVGSAYPARNRLRYVGLKKKTSPISKALIFSPNNPLVAGSLAPAIFVLSAAIFKNKIKCKNKGSRNLA